MIDIHVIKNRKRKCNGDYLYNGIDRLDNDKGYTEDNVVSCCDICNKAKRDLPFDIFIQWVKNITNYASKINFNYTISDTN